MAVRPCLGCRRLIPSGSRCPACARSSPYQRTEWRQLAAQVVMRDGACVRCGSRGPFLSAHHVIPRLEGGPDHPDNLETLCVSCHGKEPR
jgi:5-methylcytosine-specific restriction endonuclease McrA